MLDRKLMGNDSSMKPCWPPAQKRCYAGDKAVLPQRMMKWHGSHTDPAGMGLSGLAAHVGNAGLRVSSPESGGGALLG